MPKGSASWNTRGWDDRRNKGSALAEKSKSTELQLPQTCLWPVGARNGGTVGGATRKDPFEVGC